jgi:hypothetical protein
MHEKEYRKTVSQAFRNPAFAIAFAMLRRPMKATAGDAEIEDARKKILQYRFTNSPKSLPAAGRRNPKSEIER